MGKVAERWQEEQQAAAPEHGDYPECCMCGCNENDDEMVYDNGVWCACSYDTYMWDQIEEAEAILAAERELESMHNLEYSDG